MRSALAIGLIATFAILAAAHVYWAAGGRRGSSAVVPQRAADDSAPLFSPPPLLTILVAVLLAGAAMVIASRAGFIVPPFAAAVRPLTVLVAIAFLGRAIGEFRYVGFFKRVRGTSFAAWDDRLFSPLCLLIGTACAVLAAG